MRPITFVFLAFGNNLNNHTMANFSILSLKKLAPKNAKIVIYTDKANYYNYLSTVVETRILDEKKLLEWQGIHKFVWRTKIKALIDSAENDPGHLIYIDADTFLLKNLDSFIEKLDNDFCFMHVKENLLSEDKAKNKQVMWQQTQNKKFGGMLVDPKTAMWNAGLVAFNETNKVMLLNRALLSTDEMCEQKIEPWLVEQLSFSLSLSATGKILPAEEWFTHYWAAKDKMLSQIHAFLSRILQQNLSIDEASSLIDINSWKEILIPGPKKRFLQKWLKY